MKMTNVLLVDRGPGSMEAKQRVFPYLPEVLDDRFKTLGPDLKDLGEVPYHRADHERLETDLRP